MCQSNKVCIGFVLRPFLRSTKALFAHPITVSEFPSSSKQSCNQCSCPSLDVSHTHYQHCLQICQELALAGIQTSFNTLDKVFSFLSLLFCSERLLSAWLGMFKLSFGNGVKLQFMCVVESHWWKLLIVLNWLFLGCCSPFEFSMENGVKNSAKIPVVQRGYVALCGASSR